MNIWYFNHYAGGPRIGKFIRAYHLSRAWAAEGHTATVFVARWHHLLERPEPLPPETIVDGMRYVALDARLYKGNGLHRILNMVDYCRSMRRLAGREDLPPPDAIIVSSPHPFGILPAWFLARRHRAKLVFEVRDLWPLSVVELNGTSRWHPFVLLCALVERFAYRRSHLVASLLGGAEAHMRAHGLGPNKFAHLPNGIDPDRKPPDGPTSIVAAQAGTVGEVTFFDGIPVLEQFQRVFQFAPSWFIWSQWPAALVFLVAGIAETNRAPFDLPEAETELVAGYLTEYGGMRFGLFSMAEYVNMIVLSALAVTLFFGGWLGPWEPLGPLWFVLKLLAVIFIFIWLRTTVPRLRYDQLMAFGWKILLPVATINALVTASVVVAV
jgi:glycosyltransferase involved in cell wall biosynthesis